MTTRIPLSRPDIGDAEQAAVREALASGRLSLGERIEAFEAALARTVGARHAVATSSGTGALHLAVRSMGLAPGDEVITTPFSFIASANCLLFEGVKPVFVDVEEDTLNIHPELVREAVGKRTRAILGVDVFGHPADWDALRAIADEFDLRLIEDSAEALGSRYRGRRAGNLGDVGVFGFYPNKQITTGEGGALVTDDDALAHLCGSLRNHGRESDGDEWIEHKRLGYNYRLSELASALGLVQLERLEAMAERRARVAAWYNSRLADVDELQRPALRDDVDLGWFVYVVRLSDRYARQDRDRVIAELRRRGIGCRNYFPPIHLQPVYRERYGYGPGDFPVCEATAERTIALPFFSGMSEAQVDEVVEQLRDTL